MNVHSPTGPSRTLRISLVGVVYVRDPIYFDLDVPVAVFPAASQNFGFYDTRGQLILKVRAQDVVYGSDGFVRVRALQLPDDDRTRAEIVAVLRTLPGIGPIKDAPPDRP